MKQLLLLLFVCLEANAAVRWVYSRKLAPSKVTRGYTFQIQLSGIDRDMHTVTAINTEANTFTVPGHDYLSCPAALGQGSDWGACQDVLFSVNGAGTPPAITSLTHAYSIRIVAGDDITLFYDTNSTSTVDVGTDLGTSVGSTLQVGKVATSPQFATVTIGALPSGVTVSAVYTVSTGIGTRVVAPLISGTTYNWNSNNRFMLDLSVSATAQIGPVSIPLTINPPRGEPSINATHSFNVVEAVGWQSNPPAPVAVPEPLWTNWTTLMNQYIDLHCSVDGLILNTDGCNNSLEQGPIKYDSGWWLHRRWKQTGVERYGSCARDMLNVQSKAYDTLVPFATYIAEGSGLMGNSSGFRIYTRGVLVGGSGQQWDGRGKMWAKQMLKRSYLALPDDYQLRENIMNVMRIIHGWCAHGYCSKSAIDTLLTNRPGLQPFTNQRNEVRFGVDYLLTTLDVIHATSGVLGQENFNFPQEFLTGLGLYDLLQIWQWGGRQDVRIPWMLKEHADWMNESGFMWDPTLASGEGRFRWSPALTAPGSTKGPNCPSTSCTSTVSGTQLAAMAWWVNYWNWAQGRGDSYRVFGDTQLQAIYNVLSASFPPSIPTAPPANCAGTGRGKVVSEILFALDWMNLRLLSPVYSPGTRQ